MKYWLLFLLFVCSDKVYAQGVQRNEIVGTLSLSTKDQYNSIYLGKDAGENLGESQNCVIIGPMAGRFFTGTPIDMGGGVMTPTEPLGNTYIGASAGIEAEGSDNTFLGTQSGQNAKGASNSAIGPSAFINADGDENLLFGRSAGQELSGDNNIYIGNASGIKHNGNNNIFIGSRLAFGGVHAGSDQLQIHSSSGSTPYPLVYGEFDERLFAIHQAALGDGDNRLRSGFQLRRSGTNYLWHHYVSSNGSYGFYNSSGSLRMTLSEAGNLTITGSLSQGSDRNRKEGIISIIPEDVLSKVRGIPISTWSYKGQEEIHMGPMAQDFYAAFGLGAGETTISTVDADGVALAAIQALATENESLKKELDELRVEIRKIRDALK